MPDDNIVAEAESAQLATLPQSLSDSYREKMGKLLDLTDDQKNRIKTWLKKQIDNWKNDTAELHRRLQDDNDLVEGIIMETDFPWVGASNVHEPLTEIYMDGSCAIEKRSMLGAGILWTAETDVEKLLPMVADVSEMMNYNARKKWNIERSIPGVLWAANRDGLGIIQCPYVEEYEKAHDIILVTSPKDFTDEFQSAEEAGISEEKYTHLQELAQSSTEEEPLEIPITFEKQTYAGPKAEIVELVDFVTIPAWVPHIKDARCRGYGKRYKSHIESIRQKSDDEVFYEKESQEIIAKPPKNELSSYTQSKDNIIGIKRTDDKEERELFELVIKGRLEDGGDVEKLLVTYSHDADILLQVSDYIYRIDFYALFNVDERPNQLVGKSIPAKLRDLNDLADTLVNQTVNSNTIGTVPMFKAQKDMKEELDPELDSSRIKPGMILWLTNFDSVAQFIVQPTDHEENLKIEERVMRVMDMYIGMPASLFAGGVPSGDPSAPGNKTNALIEQGNIRMESPLSFLRQGMGDLGDICLSHVYQFGPPSLTFMVEQAGENGVTTKKIKTIHKKFLRKDIHMSMNGVSVIDNPDSEMAKQYNVHQMLMTTPAYANNPELQVEVLRDALQKGNIAGRDRYLPSNQALKVQAVEVQKQAITQLEQEKQAQQAAALEEQVKSRLAKGKQQLQIKKTATDLASANLDLNGEPQ